MTLPAVTIDKALTDPQLLGAALGDPETWGAWLTVLRAAFGESLSAEDAATLAEIAGGRKPPERRVRELWNIVGRRSGKSRMAAAIAVFLAAFNKHELAPGEVGHVLVLAASRSQARAVFEYARAFFEDSPLLSQLVEDVKQEEIHLKGRVVVSVHTNNYRTVRGRTLLACIFDEVAFWRDEYSASPDVETYRAVLPALATTNGMLIGISSPYAQRGLLHQKYRNHFGKDDAEVLVIQAPTRVFNPTIDESVIEAARSADPEAAAAEWMAEFRGDLSTFVSRDVVEGCIERGVRERWPVRGIRYQAFADPSGGQHDSFALAISHREEDRAVLDATREWRAPFSTDDVVEEAAHFLKEWRVTRVWGDRYAGSWVEDAFRRYGIRYAHCDKNRSQLYLEALPMLTSRRAELLEDDRLINQICQLERRTVRNGRDSVDHGPGGMDDLANAALGSLVYTTGEKQHEAPRVVHIEGASSSYDILTGA